ncbi:hypothetical protein BN1723_007752 [Verticillium longisporum]|nr:hypothetical protein BN1723_007752 [Verticillium longisporum]
MTSSPPYSQLSPFQADVGDDPSVQELVAGNSNHESPATLTLQRVFEQSRRGVPKKDDADKPVEVPPGPPAKGKPRLLLMGQRRSGKSSISSVVFHKLPPNETLFLESTARIQKDSMA